MFNDILTSLVLGNVTACSLSEYSYSQTASMFTSFNIHQELCTNAATFILFGFHPLIDLYFIKTVNFRMETGARNVNESKWQFLTFYVEKSGYIFTNNIFRNDFNANLMHFVVGKMSYLAKDNQPITICLNVYLFKVPLLLIFENDISCSV